MMMRSEDPPRGERGHAVQSAGLEAHNNSPSTEEDDDARRYSRPFHIILLPKGEFTLPDDEDEMNFRRGLELRHRALLSIWYHHDDYSDNDIGSRQKSRAVGRAELVLIE